MGRRTDIDWPAIEVDVKLGMISMRQIARKHKVAESNLRARAKREEWQRGEGDAVRVATKAALSAANTARAQEIGAEIGAQQARLYEGGLREIAWGAAEVAAEHQAVARSAMKAAVDLLRLIEAASQVNDVIAFELEQCRVSDRARAAAIDKLLGLRSRVEMLDRWAGAFSKLASTEREAHGMNSSEQHSSLDELLIRIANEREQGSEPATDANAGVTDRRIT